MVDPFFRSSHPDRILGATSILSCSQILPLSSHSYIGNLTAALMSIGLIRKLEGQMTSFRGMSRISDTNYS